MNKRQLELAELDLEREKEILNRLKQNYAAALAVVKNKINLLQADEATTSKIYQIKHQKMLERQLEGSLKLLQKKNYKTVDEYLRECYETGFIGNMYDLQGQGLPMVVPIDQNKAVSTARKTADGFKLSEKLGGNTKLLKKQVLAEISRGLSAEKSYQTIARNISNYGQANLNRTMRIVRTESGRIHSEATNDSIKAAKERGADIVKQWDSTLDGKTRPLHRQLDGKYCEVDEPFEVSGLKVMYPGGFGDPAEDCNCRCRLISRARLAVEGEKTYSKMNNLTGELIKCSGYKDFEKKYLEKLKENKKQGIIPINIQLFARKASDFKTIRLSKAEYAHVISEIATNLTEEQRSQQVFDKFIGDYIYRVENIGFGNYRIIDKIKIEG